MSDSLDFTSEGKHTRFFDCYIICGGSAFMAHRHMLCKIDMFDRLFNGDSGTHIGKPKCLILSEHEEHINIFLNHMYEGKFNHKDVDIIGIFSLFDHIGYFEAINKIINEVYMNLNLKDYTRLIEYITDNENVSAAINYKKIFKLYVTKCVDTDRLDLLATIKCRLFVINSILAGVKNNIKYVKILESLYKNIGEEILLSVTIDRFIDPESSYMCMYSDASKYIAEMNETSSVRNYLVMKYLGHLYTCDRMEASVICDTVDTFCL